MADEDETQVEAPAPAPEAAAPAEPAEILHPKERRRRARATRGGEARPAQTPEERHEARKQLRAQKAKARATGRVKAREKARATRAAAPSAETPTVHEHGPGRPKVRQGVVVSDKGAKTITVRIDTSRRHRRYKKIVRSSTTLHVHDERDEAGEGDLVRVVETRPLSRTKRWRLTDILERAR